MTGSDNDDAPAQKVALGAFAILKDAGFTSSSAQALGELCRCWRQQLVETARAVSLLAASNGRTEPHINDLLALPAFARSLRRDAPLVLATWSPAAAVREIARGDRISALIAPIAPLFRSAPAIEHTNATDAAAKRAMQAIADEALGKVEPPQWMLDEHALSLPPLPPAYSFHFTPISHKRGISSAEIRVRATDENRLAEQALERLMNAIITSKASSSTGPDTNAITAAGVIASATANAAGNAGSNAGTATGTQRRSGRTKRQRRDTTIKQEDEKRKEEQEQQRQQEQRQHQQEKIIARDPVQEAWEDAWREVSSATVTSTVDSTMASAMVPTLSTLFGNWERIKWESTTNSVTASQNTY